MESKGIPMLTKMSLLKIVALNGFSSNFAYMSSNYLRPIGINMANGTSLEVVYYAIMYVKVGFGGDLSENYIILVTNIIMVTKQLVTDG